MPVTLRKRVLVGCLVVAAVVLVTDVVLAATFRSFLLGRIDQQIVEGADPLVHGRFRNGFPGTRPVGGTPAGNSGVYTEYFIGLVAADGTVTRIGPGLHDDDSAPKLSPAALASHLSKDDDLRPFTVPSSTGGGNWRVVALQRSGDEGTFVFGAQLKDLDATFGRI